VGSGGNDSRECNIGILQRKKSFALRHYGLLSPARLLPHQRKSKAMQKRSDNEFEKKDMLITPMRFELISYTSQAVPVKVSSGPMPCVTGPAPLDRSVVRYHCARESVGD
jgi:hypothetical protein